MSGGTDRTDGTELHHAPPAPGRFFVCAGSPLNGKRMPADWEKLNCFQAKAEALRKAGLACSWVEACSLLGRHAAAVKATRQSRAATREREVTRKRRWWQRD